MNNIEKILGKYIKECECDSLNKLILTACQIRGINYEKAVFIIQCDLAEKELNKQLVFLIKFIIAGGSGK